MNLPSPISLSENREIDGFDLLEVLGLMKEYNRQEIWRRYLPAEAARLRLRFAQADQEDGLLDCSHWDD